VNQAALRLQSDPKSDPVTGAMLGMDDGDGSRDVLGMAECGSNGSKACEKRPAVTEGIFFEGSLPDRTAQAPESSTAQCGLISVSGNKGGRSVHAGAVTLRLSAGQ